MALRRLGVKPSPHLDGRFLDRGLFGGHSNLFRWHGVRCGQELREALGGLGYTPDEVRSVLVDLGGDDPAVLLREALQRLARA